MLVAKAASVTQPPGIAQQWPTLLMIKLGRITMHRFSEALEPLGIRPRHVAALIELRDRGELTQQSLCGQLHLDPTNLVVDDNGARASFATASIGPNNWPRLPSAHEGGTLQ